ncbi:hypothetical protein [Fictibacillus sp. NRS-1165]|uniref:hypothetical protein n=1 Tax=Fictibacillus sp. NRS-1165 TaxID=3144463 RepID=UPI003D1A72E8
MDWIQWQERVQNTAFLQPLIGMGIPHVKAEAECIYFSFTSKSSGSKKTLMISGSRGELQEMLDGHYRLSDLIKQKKVTFSGTYREQLKLESLLFLCKKNS